MARKNVPSIEDNLLVTRERLWNKRLDIETKCLRACHPERGRPPSPLGEGFHAVLFRTVLRFAGLLERGLLNANQPQLRKLRFSLPTLPAAFDGFRILQLSDFHFNDRGGFVEAMCGILEDVSCDLCVFTGDYRFNRLASCRSVYQGMRRLLKTVPAPFGHVAILGNNDMSDFVPGFRGLGIRVLVNESIAVSQGGQTIWIAGVDDPHEFYCDSLPLALQDVPAGAFTLLLAHSPEIIPQAGRYGVDLYLCGHTHGGQICLPHIGPLHLNARCQRKYAAGQWRYGNVQGYTTTGIGASTIPIRFNCPPEAVLIELAR